MRPRVLVYTRTVGFRHDSIADGTRAFVELGRKHGWGVEATEDLSALHEPSLSERDVVVFLNTNGSVLDERGREAFRRFLQSGKGFVGVHGAAATELDWPWYAGLVGATFKAHPAPQPASISVVDADHPATRHLPKSWRRIDEWYGFHACPRDEVRLLLTLDETSYEPGEGAMGRLHPLAWCHAYDGGRAFYTALGHGRESYEEPLYLAHLAGAVAWASATS